MNTAWLAALGLALILVVGLALLQLRRGRRAPPAPPRQQPLPPVARAPAPAAPAPSAAPPRPVAAQAVTTPVATPVGPAADIDARRQANTEALRLARQRKAEEAARLETERAAQARAEAVARSAIRPVPAPPPPAAARSPAGWASRPMALGPAEPVAMQPARPLAPVQPVTPVQPPAPQRPVAPRVPVVLVADDSKVVRVKTGRLLERQGWQVLLADDGAAALALLDSHTPDLLITDVEMPGVDGFALTRQVRDHARCARLPVIMITSSDAQHRDEAQAAGVDLLLGKPYAEETLLAQAQRLLGVTAPVLH